MYQVALRKFHSVETVFLKIQNDLLLAIDKKQILALVLLDLSAAFDTVDHQILLQRLSSYFGIKDSALNFLQSYLLNRSQAVSVNSMLSPSAHCTSGVPQGSVLEPLLFSLYTTPLADQIESFKVHYHMFADDSQLYISFSAENSSVPLTRLTTTLDFIHLWLSRKSPLFKPI